MCDILEHGQSAVPGWLDGGEFFLALGFVVCFGRLALFLELGELKLERGLGLVVDAPELVHLFDMPQPLLLDLLLEPGDLFLELIAVGLKVPDGLEVVLCLPLELLLFLVGGLEGSGIVLAVLHDLF